MRRDSLLMRGPRPFLFADLKSGVGRDELLAWLKTGVSLCLSRRVCA